MSRLERLFTLLETGSTPAIRKAAAQQIGEVQRLHPHELQSLLDNLHSRLLSKDWDTRIAAGQAIEAIASHVPLWNPQYRSSSSSDNNNNNDDNNNNNNNTLTTTTTTTTTNNDDDELMFDLTFEKFDITKVLSNGSLLLASGGQEFEPEPQMQGVDPKEILKIQRRKIKKKLGLDDITSNGMELIDDEDLIYIKKEPTNNNNNNSNQQQQQSLQQQEEDRKDIGTVLDTSGMSAREKNKAKRKAKSTLKESTSGTTKRYKEMNSSADNLKKSNQSVKAPTKQHITEQPQNSGVIVLESVLDVDKAYNQDEWPFTSLYDDLLIDLFNPQWEIRHGSAVGLRELCRKHGKGGGVTVYTKPERIELVNTLWLEDFAIRLLCVIALDRFGDYISDQVVAPVRETCAQVLGLVVKYMNADSVMRVLSVLLHLQDNKQWEVRHGGLLGIKYLAVVRLDLIDLVLPRILDAITKGLSDRDDDVRATASETFQPLAKQLVANHRDRIQQILTILWDILLELDDLAVSTASVLNLLADFYSFSDVILPTTTTTSNNNNNNGHVQYQQQQQQQQSTKLSELVPRLYPFFRHLLYSVRLSAIQTVNRLIMATGCGVNGNHQWLLPILTDLLRYVFQNIILEERHDIVEISLKTWNLLILSFEPAIIRQATLPFLVQWISLLSTVPGTPMNQDYLLFSTLNSHSANSHHPSAAAAAAATQSTVKTKLEVGQVKRGRPSKASVQAKAEAAANTNSNNGTGVASSAPPREVEPASREHYLNTRAKVMGTNAIAIVIRMWPTEQSQEVMDMLLGMVTSASAIQRHLASMILTEIFYCSVVQTNGMPTVSIPPQPVLPPTMVATMSELLNDSDPTWYYHEADTIIKSKLASDSKILSQSLMNVGIDFTGVALLVQWVQDQPLLQPETILPLSLELISNVYAYCLENIQRLIPASTKNGLVDQLEARRKTILATMGYIDKLQKEMHTMVLAAVDGALIASNNIPAKVTPAIRSLLHSIRNEEDDIYQFRTAHSLAHFVQLCATRTPCPNDKVIKSMFSVLCEDRTHTPLASIGSDLKFEEDNANGVLLLQQQQQHQQQQNLDSEESKIARLGRRGANEFFIRLVGRLGETLFNVLPTFFPMISQNLVALYQETTGPSGFTLVVNDFERLQLVIDELQLFKTVLPKLHPSFHSHLIDLIPIIFHFVQTPNLSVQSMVSKTIAQLCLTITLPSMHHLIYNMLPLLGDSKSSTNRYGAITTLLQIINDMSLEIVPYIVFLTIPVLGCMSDQEIPLRKKASLCFAKLVKLMPLEPGVPNPVGLDEKLVQQKLEERKFLEQLLDGSKVEQYPLPIRINTELRKYQQDGVNWLAFLNKYKLHGILCDDMGLGKTLQAICIMAGDDYDRRVNFAAKGTPNFQPLPSIVVCPSTLVGHWYYEIKKFCDTTMRPMTYMGAPAERAALRAKFKDHNVLIMSYDIVRNDIDHLTELSFNYCILDEGHIIKNTKTKLTQAVKQLKSNHRLILSGTPIQNNVLELWSLFDFLMPGFLGTERQFDDLYSKPILASKDPKCTPKDQEAGALAMEALHRQGIDQEIISEDADEEPQETKKSTKKGGQATTHVFQALQYLRKLCSHPQFVLNQNHPQYNAIIKELKASKSDITDIEHSPKLTTLKELLLECGIGVQSANANSNNNADLSQDVTTQHRVLIFAQMKSMLDVVETDLLKHHMPSVTYLRMDGSTDPMKRHSIVNQFNSDPSIDLLLLTTHVGGLGLNLTGADTVIFLEHDWNPMKDLQAMDRAHRIGQKKVVNVYRLITAGTLEEKIMGLQRFKLNIANTIVNQENQSIQTMSTNELLNLFDYNESDSQKKESGDNGAVNSMGQVEKPSKSGLKNVLASIGELWDESQYTEEFDINNFIGSLQ
ncbi:SNF2-related domain-containing protein [Heterostelium album PN500]|uniref:SNF2-related domain-containing protein n=1 Tax=Heterostelium pallidum (strain ATCC 26659 / Pp 5 / PN500) TaxID=670386 RepID=D3AYJ5_HETP5|nr:SNF2-related domain-containing protein [Heterostelium album PN500]EFA86022.1 SNF2-related domain-containing protein [Heterostelium album PN500]|eukprot:XP_020438128.1 SNF2-related domain-containing protein [Heterostelium album PN500]